MFHARLLEQPELQTICFEYSRAVIHFYLCLANCRLQRWICGYEDDSRWISDNTVACCFAGIPFTLEYARGSQKERAVTIVALKEGGKGMRLAAILCVCVILWGCVLPQSDRFVVRESGGSFVVYPPGPLTDGHAEILVPGVVDQTGESGCFEIPLIPGETTMWLSMEDASVLDDSNPLGREGGESYCQRCGEDIGYKGLGPDTCLQGPDGCQVGWEAADIEITANKAWLADEPAARAMFNVFAPPLIDLAIAGVALDASDGSQAAVEAIAAQWITDNRALADEWVATAIAAG